MFEILETYFVPLHFIPFLWNEFLRTSGKCTFQRAVSDGRGVETAASSAVWRHSTVGDDSSLSRAGGAEWKAG